MLYPTHSVSMILSVTGARMTEVSCMGYRDRLGDGVFDEGVSMWKNALSNETALFRTSDGGMARINEFRRVGYNGYPEPEVRMSLFGTNGSFEAQTRAASWNTVGGQLEDLTSQLKVRRDHQKLEGTAEYEQIPGAPCRVLLRHLSGARRCPSPPPVRGSRQWARGLAPVPGAGLH